MARVPPGYDVHAVIDWESDHPATFEASGRLADALGGTEWTVLTDERADRHLLVTEQEDE